MLITLSLSLSSNSSLFDTLSDDHFGSTGGYSELIICSNLVGETTFTDHLGAAEVNFFAAPELILW